MRVYHPGHLSQGDLITLNEQTAHHIARVLRAKVGDPLQLFNGLGGEYFAQITQIDKKDVWVLIGDFLDREAESPIELILAQGIARGEKMDFIVQKAVELGVFRIIPLLTERCNVRLKDERADKKLKHWQSVVVSACEQSGRNRLPLIEGPQHLTAWLKEAEADQKFVLSPHGNTSFTPKRTNVNSILLLIGPEGGLTENELLAAKGYGFTELTLGPRILRTETAPITALSIFQAYYGDLSSFRKVEKS